MIQFNLLPDVKLEYIKTQRLQRLIISVCIIASAAALALFLVMVLVVDVWQNRTISGLTSKIQSASSQLQATPNLNKVLTVQNQLNSLDSLHSQKPEAKRLFSYLHKATPDKATISDMTVDFTQNTMTITGAAPTLKDVNTFVDSLKFTMYKTGADSTAKHAFTGVVLSSFGRNEQGATYTIDLSFDSIIFDNSQDVQLIIPKRTTTRSIVDSPNVLFNEAPKTSGEDS